jgi:Flp pilus assembly protein TadG
MRMPIRNPKGHTAIELASICIIFVVVTVLCLDVGVMILASGSNERACRDACRAAAETSDSASALAAAQAACAAHAQNGGYFAAPPTVDATTFLYQDFAATNGVPPAPLPPSTPPTVRVTTQTTVTIPAPIVFMGLIKFGGPGQNTMNFRKTYVFPIVRQQLFLPPGGGGGS